MFQAKLADDSLLTEAERKVIQPADSLSGVAGDRDPATARSLVDDSREATLNANWSTGLGERGMDGSLSLNGSVTRAIPARCGASIRCCSPRPRVPRLGARLMIRWRGSAIPRRSKLG